MSTTGKPPIDTATVQRCIELLKGTGEYRRVIHWDQPSRTSETRETWTYTTHPMDLLAGLLEPEPTEAEKLVSAWAEDAANLLDADYWYEELVELAQFILDKQARDGEALMRTAMNNLEDRLLVRTMTTTGTMKASPEEIRAINEALGNVEPQFVYGPWMPAVDGQTPPFPVGWFYQMRAASTGVIGTTLECRGAPVESIDTEYRVRFEVGKWYDWAGGDCPVGAEVRVEVGLRDAGTNSTYTNPTYYRWGHGMGADSHDIIKFRIMGIGETA